MKGWRQVGKALGRSPPTLHREFAQVQVLTLLLASSLSFGRLQKSFRFSISRMRRIVAPVLKNVLGK